jgi:hypothetical protein
MPGLMSPQHGRNVETTMTDATTAQPIVQVVTGDGYVNELVLQIGRTGEKAKFQGREVKIDLRTIPAASLAFALQYGLKQYIADGTAGSEDQTGYDVGIDQRLAKLAEGDFTRKTGERATRADTPEGRAKKLAVAAIRAKLQAAGQKADVAKINEAAAKMVEAQPVWLERAKKMLKEEAALADSADIGDVLGDMLGLTE